MTIKINPPALPPIMTAQAIAAAVLRHVQVKHRAPTPEELCGWIDYRHPHGKTRTLEAMAILAQCLMADADVAAMRAAPLAGTRDPAELARDLTYLIQQESKSAKAAGRDFGWNEIRATLTRGLA